MREITEAPVLLSPVLLSPQKNIRTKSTTTTPTKGTKGTPTGTPSSTAKGRGFWSASKQRAAVDDGEGEASGDGNEDEDDEECDIFTHEEHHEALAGALEQHVRSLKLKMANLQRKDEILVDVLKHKDHEVQQRLSQLKEDHQAAMNEQRRVFMQQMQQMQQMQSQMQPQANGQMPMTNVGGGGGAGGVPIVASGQIQLALPVDAQAKAQTPRSLRKLESKQSLGECWEELEIKIEEDEEEEAGAVEGCSTVERIGLQTPGRAVEEGRGSIGSAYYTPQQGARGASPGAATPATVQKGGAIRSVVQRLRYDDEHEKEDLNTSTSAGVEGSIALATTGSLNGTPVSAAAAAAAGMAMSGRVRALRLRSEERRTSVRGALASASVAHQGQYAAHVHALRAKAGTVMQALRASSQQALQEELRHQQVAALQSHVDATTHLRGRQ
jgi:hypothetical protein